MYQLIINGVRLLIKADSVSLARPTAEVRSITVGRGDQSVSFDVITRNDITIIPPAEEAGLYAPPEEQLAA
jgi:hypothetical protein